MNWNMRGSREMDLLLRALSQANSERPLSFTVWVFFLWNEDSIHLCFPPQLYTLLEGEPCLSHHWVPSPQCSVCSELGAQSIVEVSTCLVAVLPKAAIPCTWESVRLGVRAQRAFLLRWKVYHFQVSCWPVNGSVSSSIKGNHNASNYLVTIKRHKWNNLCKSVHDRERAW